MTTKVSVENKAKLDRQWKDFESTIGEEDASISGGETNDTKAMSNFCPEVSYNIFGLFASGLYPHHGEIDRDLAYTRLNKEGAKSDDPRWNWADFTPRHYTECPEYSILQARETKLTSDLRNENMNDKSSEAQESKNPKCVFVVHGRNMAMRDSMFAFLRAIGLQPLEWSQAVKATGEASPYIGNVLDTAFSMAQAIVVLMTPDDEARLRKEFHSAHDDHYEKQLTSQARPNVLFEAGMAMGRNPKRTVLVQVGQLRPFSDVGGRHVLRLKNTSPSRQELADRLRTAGCDVDLSGTDWHSVGSFDAPLVESTAEPENGKNFVQWKTPLLQTIAGLKLKMRRLRPGEWYPEYETSIVDIAEHVAVVPDSLDAAHRNKIVEIVTKLSDMNDSEVVYGTNEVIGMLTEIESLLK